MTIVNENKKRPRVDSSTYLNEHRYNFDNTLVVLETMASHMFYLIFCTNLYHFFRINHPIVISSAI